MEGLGNDLTKEPAPQIPQEVLEGGLQSVLRYIHDMNQLRPTPLRRHVANVESTTKDPSLSDMSLRGATSVETNAIAAHLIAGIWPKMSAWTKEHEGRIAHRADADAHTLRESPDALMHKKFLIDSKTGFRALHEQSQDVCEHFVRADMEARSQKGDRAVERLETLIEAPGYENYRNDPAQFLLAGFVTANDTIWGLLNSIPSVYRRTYGYGKKMTKEEYAELAKSAKRISLTLATTQLNVFGMIREEIEGDSYHTFVANLQLKGLRIIEENDSMRLDFEPETLRTIAESALNRGVTGYRSVARTGCPALFVNGQESANVIADYFDWCYSLAEKYYLPTLEK